MTAKSEVAQIFHQGEQTSVIVSHQQKNGVIECESIMADKGLVYMVIRIGPMTEP